MYQEKGLYRPYAKLMKETVDVPVICAGRMDNPDMALEAVENGTTDMISLGRPLLADPDYVNKLRAGRIKDIIDVDIPYPRDQETKMSPRFLELKNQIWSQVYHEYLEVRK